ncbi:alpha/beta fold hydrolase [Pseudogemmobacter sonorensis]|uniref:alpha/beta fold hydrolase n=1 Tax=Pseudogemmobacter sonorensis TaxID=2989681 RepID=UPI003678FDAF
MADILLIHGSGHGAWCWHRVIPALRALGHDARAIDLPGRGGAATSLADQAGAILAALPGPAVVLGHSAAGLPITAAAEIDPARIRALVYLCAYAPRDGSSVGSLRREQRLQPLPPAIRVDRATASYGFDPAQIRELFYHDCPPEDLELAARHLCAEPIAPQETALALTPRSQDLPRFYLRCTDDRAIPPEDQARMALTVPQANRFELPCGHSPFFAAPALLAARLDEIAARL